MPVNQQKNSEKSGGYPAEYDPYTDNGDIVGSETDTTASGGSTRPLDVKDAGTDSPGGRNPNLRYGDAFWSPRIT